MQRTRKVGVKVIAAIAATTMLLLGMTQLSRDHFDRGTTVNDIDCSLLSAEAAKEEIEKLSTKDFHFQVLTLEGEKVTYTPDEEWVREFDIQVEDIQKLNDAMKTQKQDTKQKNFKINDLISVNETAIQAYLRTIPELQEENMVTPQNAYVRLASNNLLEVVPEVKGNQIDFDEACNLAVSKIKAGEKKIDLIPITKTMPEITSENEELLSYSDDVNAILQTVIEFKLENGEEVKLDLSTMKNWITQSEDGSYYLDIDANLHAFIENLATKVTETDETLIFEATELGTVELQIPNNKKAELDVEAEYELVKEYIESAKSCTAELIYSRKPLTYLMDHYVELDRNRQTLWEYKSGEKILETECVTGDVAKGHSTPTGIYYPDGKRRNIVLTDHVTYWSPVKVFIPFCGGIGFHDASWRYDKYGNPHFGGDIYKTNGSHGCVNMPIQAALELYDNIEMNTVIIIYDSANVKVIAT